MSDTTKIQWADATASPWHGCTEVHAGCDHCYAREMAKRNPKTLGVWGQNGTRVRSASFWDNCRRWNREAKKAGVVRSVFPSICDPFESWGGKIHDSKGNVLIQSYLGDARDTFDETTEPWEKYGDKQGWKLLTMDDLRRDLFALIDECTHLRFLLLTKRPQNIQRMWPIELTGRKESPFPGLMPPMDVHSRLHRPNVWLLTSVSDQATADAMIPHLLKCRDLVPVLGLSAEPLLGSINLEPYLAYPPFHEHYKMTFGANDFRGVDYVIVGGESGNGARAYDVAWPRSIIKQCREAGVACFHKQLGAHVIDLGTTIADNFPEEQCWPEGTKTDFHRVLLKDKKGGTMEEWPEDLRVREMPKVERTVIA